MSESVLRVGVLGGTFDPIHVGHVLLAMYLRERWPLDRVVFVPAAAPPHKLQRADMASAEARYQMACLAVAGLADTEVSRVEVERDGPSYTVDTLAQLQAQHPDWSLHLLIGADNVAQIRGWHRPADILARCTVLAGSRTAPGAAAATARATVDPWAAQVRYVTTPAFDVSSTEIRARVRAGLPLRCLVPEGVERYIHAHGLYRTGLATPAAT